MFSSNLSSALCFDKMSEYAVLLRLDPEGARAPQVVSTFLKITEAGLSPDGQWAFLYHGNQSQNLTFISLVPSRYAIFRFCLEEAVYKMRFNYRGDEFITLSSDGSTVRTYTFAPRERTLYPRARSHDPHAKSLPCQMQLASNDRRVAVTFSDGLRVRGWVVVHSLVQ